MRRVNTFQYKEALLQQGHTLVKTAEEADKVLVWTCAVRGDFHDNSIEVLKNFERDGYDVIAAGCLPSINPTLIKNEFNGELIHYNNDKKEFALIFGQSHENAPYPVAEAPITIPLEEYKKYHPEFKIGNDDQYIKLFLSEGCTKNCSYCTEIKAFPPYRSFPASKIIEKAKDLVERTGVKQLALFGDDIGAYGTDRSKSLIDLIRELIKIDPEVKISLKQINPLWCLEFGLELKELIEAGKIFQVLVPIQSANDRILNLMRRGYTIDDLEFLFSIVFNKPGLELETHIITGFPSETKEEWEETVDFICKYKFRYVMGNIFMPGPGTDAAKMEGQVEKIEKERRMLTGVDKMERNNTVVGHDLSDRSKEHTTLEHIDFTEL